MEHGNKLFLWGQYHYMLAFGQIVKSTKKSLHWAASTPFGNARIPKKTTAFKEDTGNKQRESNFSDCQYVNHWPRFVVNDIQL